jgi:hypothetical protein
VLIKESNSIKQAISTTSIHLDPSDYSAVWYAHLLSCLITEAVGLEVVLYVRNLAIAQDPVKTLAAMSEVNTNNLGVERELVCRWEKEVMIEICCHSERRTISVVNRHYILKFSRCFDHSQDTVVGFTQQTLVFLKCLLY